MTIKLYQYEQDFGRSGSLSSTFIADSDYVKTYEGFEAYFSDILGKHSEVHIDLFDPKYMTVTELTATEVALLRKIFKSSHLGGEYLFDGVVEQYEEQQEEEAYAERQEV